ncbi:MAG: 2-amino-4-hydroxy-6-hydroxymethyldihydropteridine diphosphokinase [Selenomonadaceae bacterium]|nr:2-amino-4-hydroxy-6-hydroxymethyldihydropteridine diphosphokinase [Selenomonadaceae bacterium]
MICYIGLGSNLGESKLTLRRAIELIKKIPAVKLLRVSSFYETEPWGVEGQPNYLNAAIKISTELEPLKLLDELQRIEFELGRIRLEHWGARTIDLDILLIEGREIFSERLTVPHKFLFARDFALVPLKEIFPQLNCKLHGDKIIRVAGSPIDFKFKLIACVDKNFGLGNKGKLLFHISEDLKNFRRLTLGHTIIFGRKTLETFPNQNPLDGRRNILLSCSHENISGAEVVGSIEKLFDVLNTAEDNFVIGGEQIFNELIPYAAEIFLTVVDAEVDADAYFPNVDEFILAESNSLRITHCSLRIAFRRYTR